MGFFLRKNTSRKNTIKKPGLKNYRDKKIASPLNFRDELPRNKEVPGYKGSAYKGMGGINKDAVMFNRLRKERPQGRQH